ncbi:MAG: methylamine methyltransferase corrinoid protein reductive activase [Methanomassiliicoccaceae archaeon]|nr:methylamine methyltransferase corrinoid protein reductive activase [Methanomassiliicoccaceae archaeon]
MASYGVALDLGTSGFRSHLIDLDKGGKILSTAVTVRHPLPGANIMDHLHFWMSSGSEVGHKIIMKTIDDVIRLHGPDNVKNIKKVAVCGNPIQLSLFENIEVRDLAFAGENRLKSLGVVRPSRKGHVRNAGDIEMISVNPEAEVIIPPAIRHEIGADALAMIMRSGMLNKKEICMVTDYGTNAEMGLYYDGELYSGSAAAGPAMEGQSIKYGVLASPHAISDVNLTEKKLWENIVLDDKLIPVVASKVDPVTGKEIKVLNYSAKGITGTGVVSSMAMGLNSGLIKLPDIVTPDKKIHLMDGIWFSEKDAQEAGKAMGAIRAGHRTLVHEVGLSDNDVKVMYMAGASGTYVDPIKAQICGMIPRCLDEVYQLGNTSLMTAHELLSDPKMLDRMQSVADSISANHVMFATSKTFEDMYILELAYWTEGMSMDMYNNMLQIHGLAPMPDIKPPAKAVRMVKSDIPEIGKGLFALEEVGMKMYGVFDGCNGCRKCEKECPEKALTVEKLKGYPTITVRSDLCLGTACKACEMNCPFKAYKFTELEVTL